MGDGLEAMRRNSTSSFYHYDALGSTFELTDAVENVTDTWHYNAWGEVLERTGTTVNPHTYVGRVRYYTGSAKMPVLVGVRYYLPAPGRFMTLDLARRWLNYAYLSNAPSSGVDPLGLVEIPPLPFPPDIPWPPGLPGLPELPVIGIPEWLPQVLDLIDRICSLPQELMYRMLCSPKLRHEVLLKR